MGDSESRKECYNPTVIKPQQRKRMTLERKWGGKKKEMKLEEMQCSQHGIILWEKNVGSRGTVKHFSTSWGGCP